MNWRDFEHWGYLVEYSDAITLEKDKSSFDKDPCLRPYCIIAFVNAHVQYLWNTESEHKEF